jgi:hypothetical protein
MTSTSTPGSIVMAVIFLTVSVGALRSMMRLWMRISKRSHVLEPSPHGVLRVVMRSVRVGRRTGPDTLPLRPLSSAWRLRSEHTAARGGHAG